MNYEGTIFVTTRKGPMEKRIEEKRERDVCGPMYEGPRKEEKKTGEKRRLQKEI